MTLGHAAVLGRSADVEFIDMTETGGKLAIMWDKVVASVPFSVP